MWRPDLDFAGKASSADAAPPALSLSPVSSTWLPLIPELEHSFDLY